jgi:S1-C subfamily serine protease
MLALAWVLLVPADIDTVEARDFPRELQVKAIKATVRITNLTKQIDGSGVILRRQGPAVYILTAAHVVKPGDQFEVSVFSDKSYPKSAVTYKVVEVAAHAAGADLALVRVTTPDALGPGMPICPAGRAPKGKDFSALGVGCRAGDPPTCVVETVKGRQLVRKKGEDNLGFYWETTGLLAKGRSGGPLLDKQGQVIGILSGVNEEQSYYSHLDEIQRFLKRKDQGWLLTPANSPGR